MLVPSRFRSRLFLEIGADGALPTEFRLFSSGWNDTENGKFLFDGAAAKAVMSAYEKWGVDLAIDLEHQMLDGGTADPTAKDARGWCKLELRPDGSLWAVDVKWTPDGAQRLTNRTQRYVSPAFLHDPKTMRVNKIINVAITSIPATHDTPALVAATAVKHKKAKRLSMDSALIKKALEAIKSGDSDAALEILQALVASAAGAAPDADNEGAPDDGNGDASPPEQNSADADGANPKDDDNSGDSKDENQDGPPAKPEKASVAAAAIARLMAITGAKSLTEAMKDMETFQKSHVDLETEKQKIASDRKTLESAERRSLCADLVKLGAEFPATVWEDSQAKTLTPKKRWANMPIEELRSHVKDQRSARNSKQSRQGFQPPAVSGSDGELVALTSEELEICKETNCKPADYARIKAMRDRKVTG